jgi:hypothetical protein
MEDGDSASIGMHMSKVNKAVTRVLVHRSNLDKSKAEYVGILVGRLGKNTKEVWANTKEHLNWKPPRPTREEAERMKKKPNLAARVRKKELKEVVKRGATIVPLKKKTRHLELVRSRKKKLLKELNRNSV